MVKPYDLGVTKDWPGGQLDPWTRNPFVYDKVRCNSLEGILQSLQFEDPKRQLGICRLSGRAAREEGKKCPRNWKLSGMLFWQGYIFDRHGHKYQEFLNEVFLAVSRNREFRRALMATGGVLLTDSTMETSPYRTVLSVEEYIGRLMILRKIIRAHYEGKSGIELPTGWRN